MLVRSDKKLTLTSRCIFAFREEPRENALIFFGQCLSSRLAQIKSMTFDTDRPNALPRPRADGLCLSCTWDAHGPSTALRREHVASASSLRAALLLVGAAPVFLVIAPPSLPVGIACVTIVRLGCGLRATHLLVRAAPFLLIWGPASFPIGVPGVAVIRLGRRLRAALLLIVATPRLLVFGPAVLPIRVPGFAVIRLGRRLHAAHVLICTAPAFLVRRPSRFPIRIPSRAVVRLGRRGRRRRGHRRRRWRGRYHGHRRRGRRHGCWGRGRRGWRRSRAPPAVLQAARDLLGDIP